jgi:hypothetical protein
MVAPVVAVELLFNTQFAAEDGSKNAVTGPTVFPLGALPVA